MDGRRPRPNPYANDLERRLNELKQKVKTLRNKQTTEYINKITKASTKLPRHTNNIEQMVMSASSCQDIQRCLQNVSDAIIYRTSLLKHSTSKLDLLTEDLNKMLNCAKFDTSVIADNTINHTNINSMSQSNINVPAISASEVNHVNIQPSPNKSNTESCCNISCSANEVNKMNHVNNKVSDDKTESSEVVTKKLENMQL